MAPSDVAIHEAAAKPATRRIVNDFSIQVATVNGSGSQTANLVLLRSIFQMGVPVSGKNMFPSNIAGLPTWYTIRANKDGYVGRKKEIDFLVAMNPETAKEDVLSLEPGAAVLYDEPLKLNALRNDLVFYPVPFDKIVAEVCKDAEAAPPRQEHDLRRRALEAARRSRWRRWSTRCGSSSARRRRRSSSTWARSRPGYAFAESHLVKQDPYARRADEQDGRDDPGRRQRGRRARLHDGGRDRGRLVSDHARRRRCPRRSSST